MHFHSVSFGFNIQNQIIHDYINHLPLLSCATAPCLPDRVVAELDCKANSFAVQWRGSIGDVGSYSAIAIGSDGTRATYDTTNTNCTIKNLKCGLTYGIVVTTPSVDCGTIEGSNYMMQSGIQRR